MRTKRRLLQLIAGCSLLFWFGSCNKMDENNTTQGTDQKATQDIMKEGGSNPDERVFNEPLAERQNFGYLYTEGNETGGNQIHIYRRELDGHLTHYGVTATGGAGNGMGLDSQGALCLSENHHWLFAVNAGDNSVSALKVMPNGRLRLADMESTMGIKPVSLTMHGNYLYVVNAGSGNICGYTVADDGRLTIIEGSNLALSSPMAGPAQIAFSPGGKYLYVTEKMTNKITSFVVGYQGVAYEHQSIASVGATPFGFAIARDLYMVVSNANGGTPHGSSCTSYSGLDSGELMAENGAVGNHQAAACWVALTKYGRYAFVTNTGSDNISTYYVASNGRLYLIRESAVGTGSHPIDIIMAPDNYYAYNINAMSHSISGYRRGFLGDLSTVSTLEGIPEFAVGLVGW